MLWSSLEVFHRLSGLEMNREKSALYTAGLTEDQTDSLAAFGFTAGTFPFRYLGLPLTHRKLRRSEYTPLFDSISARFNHWTTKALSFAGRLQLVSSVIYSTVNFWISAFLLPKSCLKTIESMCNHFLWSGDIAKKHGVKVAWHQICLPKEEGGLGLRNFSLWNKTLNLKLIWLLFSKSDSLWVAWIRSHYLRHDSFWNTPLRTVSSWIWKAMLSLRPLAKRFLRCDVSNGQSASFWFDHWFDLGPLIDLVGNNGPQLMGIPIDSKVSEAYDSRGWRLPPARTRNHSLAAIRECLLRTPIPLQDALADCFDWIIPGSETTTFSSALTWDHLRPRAARTSWSKIVWFKGCVPKHAFNFWVAFLDRLPVRDRLVRWGLEVSDRCLMCSQSRETRDHIFLSCAYSQEVWSIVSRRLGARQLNEHWGDFMNWLNDTGSPPAILLKCLVSQAAIYLLWRERNSRLHEGPHLPASALFKQLDRCVKDAILARIHRNRFRELLGLWFALE